MELEEKSGKVVDLVKKINEIQSLCIDVPNVIELPQIVVVGSQSSGKSSVLENIVGGDFLPRGPDMVTRRPLIIQILGKEDAPSPGASAEGGSPIAYCVFGHLPNRRFLDLAEVKREIEEETSRLLQNKNDVSQIPILLKIVSEKHLSLTLIDLPGLVKVPAEGQPADICSKIEEITRNYVRNRSAIIIAVSPANSDISSSDGLMLAKEVDPKLERTLCVLTKVDLMDPGTNAVGVLMGKIVKLRLGFVPVVCRGHAAVARGTSIEEAIGEERRFFGAHPAYASKARFCGVPYLVERLHAILHEHVKACVPSLQEKIGLSLRDAQAQVRELGPEVESPRQFVLQLISDFKSELEAKIKGGNIGSTSEILEGARIAYALNVIFSNFVSEFKPFQLGDNEVRTILLNSSGMFETLAQNTGFEYFIRRGANALRPHCMSLVSLVLGEISSIISKITASPRIRRFPLLAKQVGRSMDALFHGRMEATVGAVNQFFDWNTSYINFKHPDFIRDTKAARAPRPPREESEEEEEEGPGYIQVGSGTRAKPAAKSALQDLTERVQDLTGKMQSIFVGKDDRRDKKPPLGYDPECVCLGPLPASISVCGEIPPEERDSVELLKLSVAAYFRVIKTLVQDQVPKIIVCELIDKSIAGLQARLLADLYDPNNFERLLREEDGLAEKREMYRKICSALEKAQELTRDL